MKLSDLVRHAQNKLPLYTRYFSDSISVTKLTAENNVCTAITSEKHNLKAGDLFTLEGAKISNKIVDLYQNRGLGVMKTQYPHEVTKNSPLRVGDSTHITIHNCNVEEYNGSFLIMDIPDAYTIEFSIDENAPRFGFIGIDAGNIQENREMYFDAGIIAENGLEYIDSGNVATRTIPEIKEDAYANFNGRNRVDEVIDDYTFKFSLPYTPATNEATGDMKISSGIRISGDFSIQNAMKAYEENAENELWGFVVLDGANVSKSKTTGTDAISEFVKGADSSLSLVQDVSFFVFVPTADDYCWIDYSDICQTLRSAVLKTFHNARFESDLSTEEDCFLSYVGDNPVDTDGTAYAIYQYKFQTTIDIFNEDGIEKEFAPRLKNFAIHEKNNFENSDDTVEYVSEGELPDEDID